jgi:hypothetical protein
MSRYFVTWTSAEYVETQRVRAVARGEDVGASDDWWQPEDAVRTSDIFDDFRKAHTFAEKIARDEDQYGEAGIYREEGPDLWCLFDEVRL